jgi:hypothetical protein
MDGRHIGVWQIILLMIGTMSAPVCVPDEHSPLFVPQPLRRVNNQQRAFAAARLREPCRQNQHVPRRAG